MSSRKNWLEGMAADTKDAGIEDCLISRSARLLVAAGEVIGRVREGGKQMKTCHRVLVFAAPRGRPSRKRNADASNAALPKVIHGSRVNQASARRVIPSCATRAFIPRFVL
jgi:hypothetical protein